MNAAYSTQAYTISNAYRPPPYTMQQPSPADSTSPTPSNVSPTSPRMAHYLREEPARQIKAPRTPLYVPAALRPTERYPAPSPMTPPKSLHGSLDSLSGETEQTVDQASTHLDAVLEHDWTSGEELGEVTGPPTREHWKPDVASPTCDSPQCRANFNLFVRKHHCRHCGHIFCANHTACTIPLNQDAKFHPDGIASRACHTCHRQFQRWDTARSLRRQNSTDNNSSTTTTSGGSTPLATDVNHQRTMSGTKAQAELASSVPRDWAWSTF